MFWARVSRQVMREVSLHYVYVAPIMYVHSLMMLASFLLQFWTVETPGHWQTD